MIPRMAQHNRVPITIRLEHFEGPLDLLLYLIQSHELNISKVSISKITDQYLAYVKLLQELNFDIASEFLVMAATLLLWKSRAILPADNDEGSAEDSDELTGPSPEDLVRQLIEHQRFLKAGDDLAQYPRLYEDVFTRSNTKPPVERIWREMNISDLTLSYQEALTKARKRKKVLKKETVSLSEKIWEFADKLTLNPCYRASSFDGCPADSNGASCYLFGFARTSPPKKGSRVSRGALSTRVHRANRFNEQL